MSDEDETPSFDVGDVVWVKLGVQWWPGEICPENQVPKEVISSHKKRPVAIVKFFHEDTYEFVKNPNHLLQYNHQKKTEFIRKGMDIFRQNNNKYMNKFPSDIQTAEEITGGDVNILSRAEFAPAKKLNYSTIFGDQTKKTKKGKTAQNKNDNLTQTPQRGRRRKSQAKSCATTYSSSQHLMNVDKNHESRIIPQTTIQTSPNASPGTYKCHLCDFSSTRQNVIVLHTKTHSGQSIPLISKKPKEPKSILKKQQTINDASNNTEESILIEDSDSDLAEEEQNKSKKSNDKSTEIHDNHSHNKRVRNEKTKSIPATVTSKCSSRSKKSSSHEDTLDAIELDDSLSDDSNSLLKAQKKTETKDELRSKLLADWSDDDEDDDLDDSENMNKKEKSKKMGKSSKEQQSTSHENYNENNSIRAPTRLEMPIRLSSDLAAIVQDSSRFDSEELAELIKQSNLSSSSSTSSINLDTQQMMTKVKSMTAATISNTTSSSTPKYRNIPKKDRRDIVLKDFDSSSSDIANENKSPAKQIVVQSENIVAIEQQEIKENVNETQTDVKEISNSDEEMLSNNEVTKLLDDVTTNTNTNSNELESEKRIEDEVHSQTIPENIEKEHLITDKDHEKENDQIDHQAINENIDEIMITSDDNSNKIEKEISSPHRKPKFSFEKQKENEKEKDDQKQQTETTATNNNNAANKVSISCFDFREEEDDEEDFLASISKLKKKYLSPDKSRDHSIDDNKDQQQQSPENEANEKIELEKKDKQLSDDIENLLNSTQLPDIVGAGKNNNCSATTITTKIPLTSSEPSSSSSSSSSSIMLHQEVRTLPPKERGKRIFKSRNRTKYEEPTTALSNNALSSTIAISNYSSSPLTTVQNIEVQPHEQFKDISPKKSSNRSKSTESLQKITITTTGDHEEEINKDKDSNVNEEIINEDKDSNVNEEGINESKDSIVNEEKINENKDSIVNEDKDSIVNEEEIIVEKENLKDDAIENETDNEITITKDKDSEIIEEDNAICESNSQSNEESSENSENIESPPYEKTTENFESAAILSEVENDEDKTCQLEEEEINSEDITTENVITEETEEIEEIKSGTINTENFIAEETQEAKSEVVSTENIITEEAEIEEEKLETIAVKEAEEEKNLEITAEETTIVSELQENTQQMVMEEIPKETYDESRNLSSENLNQNKENVSQILVEEIIKETYDESRNLSPVSLNHSRENESQENVPQMIIEEIPKETYDESRNLSLISLSQSRENELAVAETLISIPSKLNEMESRKSKQQLLMQQENDKNLSMSECDTIVIVQSEETSKKEDRNEQENIPRVISPLIKETEVTEQQIEEEKPMPQPSSQRKRRAHMKITPRKRIIQESPSEPIIIQQVQNQTIERVVIPDKSVKIIFTSPEDKPKTSKQNEERVSPDTTVTQQKEEKTDILSSERSLSSSDITQTSTEQSSSEDNFVEKYIKDAMMFVNDDSPIQNQDDIGKISKNESEAVTEEKQNITSTTSVKNQLNEENNVKDNEKKESIKQNETEDNALKLTGKQITEILDLRSMGMRADTPKNDIDDNVSSTVTIKLLKTDKAAKDTDLKSKNDPEKVITEKPEKIPETVAVQIATTETVTTTTSKTNIKIIEKSNEKMQSTKQEVPKIIESSTNEETVSISETSETIKGDLKAPRRRSKELTNLLQSVDIGAQIGKRSKSPASESKITEMPREILKNDHVSVNLEMDDQNQKKLKQQQSLPTKEFSNVRSFRPRKAKENIDARIRASLSPPLPADNLTVTQKTSTSTYSELIQAQKLTSLKDVIKTSKIELEHRLSQSNEQKPNEDKNQQSDKEQEQTCPEIVEQVVESTSFEIAKSEKASTTNVEKHSKVQQQIIVIESKPQQKLVENLKNKSQNENKSNLIIIDKSTKIDSTKEKEIKKMIPEIISRNETSAKVPVKLQHQTLQQQQQSQRQRKQSTEVSQMKTTSGEYLLEQSQKQQSKPEQIKLTTKIDPKTTNSSNTSDGRLLLGNKQKVFSNVVMVENKQETVRVPKKRKPAFDDIEDIPSFVIPKRPVISVTSSSPTIDQQQQLQQQKQSPQPQQQLQKQQQHKGESSLKKIEKIVVPPATEIIEIQQQKTQQKQQQHKGESSLIVEKVVVPPPATEIIEIQHQSQQSQQQQKIICKTIDDATMFDINNLPILLTNESVLHTGDGNMNQVHIVITPHSNPTSTAAATITALPVTESMPQSLLSSSSMASSSTIATVMPPSNKNSVTKKKTMKQQSNVTGSQSGAEVSHQKSGKSKQAAKVLIQDEPKQIGIDGKGNKFVIVRSENGAKMIIQPDTSPKIKRKDTQVHSSVKSLTATTTTTTTTTAKSIKATTATTASRRKSQSPTVSQQQLSYQHQSSSAINSNKNIGTSEKTSVISSQIISPTTGKHILSKASGGPSLPVGTDSNLVITSKGNVYTSNTKNVSTTSNLSNNKTIDSRNTQTSVSITQIYNVSPTATSAAASNLTRRLSRQGTTLQPLTGDRIGRQQINIEEPPKVIIQPKTMVDEICSPQPQAQHILQQQLEPGEISASEAAELTSRFGFIEVQQVQSPPPQIEPINTPTTIINKKFETVAPTSPILTKHVQQQHKTSRKNKNKVEDISATSINKFNLTEVPPLATLIGDSQQLSQPQQQHQQQQQQQHQQQQHQQQPSRSAVKRKSVSSTSQVAQQQSTQTSSKQAKRISTPTPIPSPDKVAGNSPSAVASTSTNLNKIDDKQMQIDDSRNLLAVTGESFGGPPGSFYLCTSEEDGYVPVDNVPLFLDANNRLLPFQSEAQTILEEGTITLQDGQIIMEAGDNNEQILTDLGLAGGGDQFVINTNDGQQMILDQQTMLAMSNQGPDGQLYITINGQSLIITPDILTTNNQSGDLSGTILLSEGIDGQITASNPDILAAALAGTEVYHQDQLLQIDNGNVLQIENGNGVQIVEQGIAFQPINPPVTAHTSETNAILTQPPIMSTLEVPSSKKKTKLDMSSITRKNETGLIGQNLEDSLAVIGVTTQASSVPSSLNLPITVTNPAIAPKSTSNPISLSGIYPSVSGLSHGSQISPSLSIANEQELVAAGYELFTTSSIDSHQTGFVSCTENSVKTKNTVNEIILQQTSSSASEHKQSNDEEEIVLTDFVGNTNDAGLNVSVSGHHHHHHHHPHHHHSNEFVVHNIEQQQQQQQQQSQHHHHHNQQINSGNFDDSTSNR